MATCTTRSIGFSRVLRPTTYGLSDKIVGYYGHSVPDHITHLEEVHDPRDLHVKLRWRTKAGNTGHMVIRNFEPDAQDEDINAAIVAMKLTD